MFRIAVNMFSFSITMFLPVCILSGVYALAGATPDAVVIFGCNTLLTASATASAIGLVCLAGAGLRVALKAVVRP